VTHLERVIEHAFGLCDEPGRTAFARALRTSIRIDPTFTASTKTFPKIARPADIERDGMTTKAQYDLRVSLLKPVALEFLLELGVPERGLAAKCTWKHYVERFGLEPFYIHHNPKIMMLTHAEWVHLVMDNPPEIRVPDGLKAYLEG
jgi:hypothetical protein